MVLVGCCSQEEEEKEVTYYTARQFADERDIPVIETSCGKESVNVEFAFMTSVERVLSTK